MTDSNARIRVLIVDDSAFARKVVRELLVPAPDIEIVGIARDGLEALEKIAELAPDVVTLDLMMPELDGVGVLRTLGERRERDARAAQPRILVVSFSDRESELGVAALELGAVDVVAKPTALATDRLYEMGGELLAKVRAASIARPATLPPLPTKTASSASPPSFDAARTGKRLVVVGTSTGGPQALLRFLSSLPSTFPVPVAIALHIPSGYTDTLAARLNEATSLRVLEARSHLVLEPGLAVLARGGMHLKVRALEQGAETSAASATATPTPSHRYSALVDVEPATAMHFPSVDVLFRSAARAAGPDVIGVVLTGMGDDGVDGARAITDAGGIVITEAEASCVVYGMPRAVVEAGLSRGQARIDEMSALLMSLL